MSRSLNFLLQHYQKTHDKVIQLYSLFEDADTSELLRIQEELTKYTKELLELAEIQFEQCGTLERHLRFLNYYLIRGDKEGCSSDINDILFYDLPATLRIIIAKNSTQSDIDERLREAVLPLIDGGHHDSAIRKTFVILTERLRRAFGVVDEIDGEDLINLVFGKGGNISINLENSKKTGA